MSPAADKIIKLIENNQTYNYLPIIGPEKGQVLVKMVKLVKPKLIVEAGTLVGYSAILMAKYVPVGGKIISLEIDKKLADIARRNIQSAHFESKVEVIVGDAKKTLKNIRETIDLLFLDAAKEEYLKYLKLVEPLLRTKSVVVADNVKIFADDVSDFLDYVRYSGKYNSEVFDFGQDAVEVSIKL